MGKIKTDDKSCRTAKSCKNEVKCKEENALSSVSYSMPKKNRRYDEGLKVPKINLSDEKFYLYSTKEKSSDVSRTREKETSSNRCVLRNTMKNKAAENEKEILTTKAEQVTLNCRSSSTASYSLSKSKSQVASKRHINDELLSQRYSDEEQPTSKRCKQVERPTVAVHIQQLNNTEPALFSFPGRYRNVEKKSTKTTLLKTVAADLSEGCRKNCELLDSHGLLVKDEPDCHASLVVDSQKSETFEVKQEDNCNDDCSVQAANVAVTKHRNEKASNAITPLLTKFDEELKSAKRSSDISEYKCDNCEGLTEGRQSNEIILNNAAADDSNCGDVIVLSVDRNRGKTTRRSRSDIPQKQNEADDIRPTCSMSTSVKQEPCVKDSRPIATAVITTYETSKLDVREFVRNSPDKTTRASNKNAGAKAAKKTRQPTKSKHSASTMSTVSPSILTRSMIKIPG